MMDRLDRTKELLMRALDDELSPEERTELDLLLADDPPLRAERERLGRLKEVTGEIRPSSCGTTTGTVPTAGWKGGSAGFWCRSVSSWSAAGPPGSSSQS